MAYLAIMLAAQESDDMFSSMIEVMAETLHRDRELCQSLFPHMKRVCSAMGMEIIGDSTEQH